MKHIATSRGPRPDFTGKYAVATGSLLDKFRFYGPFDTIDDAVAWVEPRQPFLGPVTVVEIANPESYPIYPAEGTGHYVELAGKDGA